MPAFSIVLAEMPLLSCALSHLSSCPNCMISEARTYFSVHKRYLEIEQDVMGYFSGQLLTLNGYRYLSLQINSWTTQLKACRECEGSSSRICQRQRCRKGLENRVISKSSETGGWWWSKWQVGFQEVWGKAQNKAREIFVSISLLIALVFWIFPAILLTVPLEWDRTVKNTEEGCWLVKDVVCSLRAGYKDSASLAWEEMAYKAAQWSCRVLCLKLIKEKKYMVLHVTHSSPGEVFNLGSYLTCQGRISSCMPCSHSISLSIGIKG